MPTYQYACTECGHGFEQFQSFSDDALTECPTCGGRLRKVFNSVGIVFKGSGFYRNDSREAAAKGKDSKNKESVGAGKSDASTDKSSDKQSDKKSESAAASAGSSSSKGSGSSGSSGSSSGGSSSGSSSTAGSAA